MCEIKRQISGIIENCAIHHRPPFRCDSTNPIWWWCRPFTRHHRLTTIKHRSIRNWTNQHRGVFWTSHNEKPLYIVDTIWCWHRLTNWVSAEGFSYWPRVLPGTMRQATCQTFRSESFNCQGSNQIWRAAQKSSQVYRRWSGTVFN